MTDSTVGPRGRRVDVALLYAGDPRVAEVEDPRAERLRPLVAALRREGIDADTVLWHDQLAGEVETRLREVSVVLVWCNPIENGARRHRLDVLLDHLSDEGTFVSAHPDAIRRVGTKDVLWDTRTLPFGSPVARIDHPDQLGRELLERLADSPRVLKQHRGHSGIGVWRVELAADGTLLVRHAARGSIEERIDLATLRHRLRPYFDAEDGGHLIDQPWQPRVRDGMVRAYLVGTDVVGFGHQAVNALHPEMDLPGPRIYHGPDDATFQPLRNSLQSSWIAMICEATGLAPDRVPLLWDCDFMFGEPRPGNSAGYVLCEVNVSSVAPYPPSAIDPLVAAVRAHLGRAH